MIAEELGWFVVYFLSFFFLKLFSFSFLNICPKFFFSINCMFAAVPRVNWECFKKKKKKKKEYIGNNNI